MKAVLEVGLVSLTFRTRTFLKIFEEMQIILLYWFVARQQARILTLQKFGFFTHSFFAEFNEIILFL